MIESNFCKTCWRSYALNSMDICDACIEKGEYRVRKENNQTLRVSRRKSVKRDKGNGQERV